MGAIAQLAAAPLFTATQLIDKRLTETESNGTIVAAWASSSPSPRSPHALRPSGEEMLWLCGIAGPATLGHLAMTRAIR